MDDLVALIPARGGSVRVLNKNMQEIGGLTLVARKVRQLLEAGISKVYVGSDSPEILREAELNGACPIIRDLIACDESKSSANTMIKDFVSRVQAKHIVWAHCTNPFINSEIYEKAINAYHEKLQSGFDSLFSVKRVQSHMWNHQGLPVNYDPYSPRHTLAKDLDPVFFQDGGFFIQPHDSAVKNSYFFGAKPFLFEVDEIIGFDINTEQDMAMAKRLSIGLDQ